MVKKYQTKKKNKHNDKLDKKYKEIYQKKYNEEKQKNEHKYLDILFKDMLVEFIKLHYPNLDSRDDRRKYLLDNIVSEILIFLRSGTSYRYFRSNIKRSSLNYYIRFFSKTNLFNKFYEYLYSKYSEKNNCDNLKYLYTDTSFIINLNCLHKFTERNKYIKNKHSIKLSLLTDKNGIPIDIEFVKGNKNDSPLLREHIEKKANMINGNKYKKNKRYKRYFMADAGYDSKESRNILEELGLVVIIPTNKRNNTSISKLSEQEKKLYKKRIRIENTFSKFKLFRRVRMLNERLLSTFKSLSYLAFSRILFSII